MGVQYTVNSVQFLLLPAAQAEINLTTERSEGGAKQGGTSGLAYETSLVHSTCIRCHLDLLPSYPMRCSNLPPSHIGGLFKSVLFDRVRPVAESLTV